MKLHRSCFIVVSAIAFSTQSARPSEGQTPADTSDEELAPAPGTTGNAANVPYIGESDPNGNPVRLARSTGHVSNYTEENIAPYKLPDPLTTFDGRPVESAQMWQDVRRPEILEFYEQNIYGQIPDNAPSVRWEVVETDDGARDGAAVMQRVVGRIGEDRWSEGETGPKIEMTLLTPAGVEQPVPALLNISFGFGRRGGGRGRPANAFDPIAEVLKHGWAYATIVYSDIQPDRADRWSEGVVSLTLPEGQSKPAPDQWGTISAWSWGISRTIDFLETLEAIDAKRISVTGASRLGKTVLWASAKDERIAAVFSVVPGEMGASLIRRDWGETLDDMAQNFHWQFCGNLQNWVGRWNELPVDQHMLIALSAPRPVYVNGGISDQWSDPKGEFLAMQAAGPVYELLGGAGLGVDETPAFDEPVTDGDLAFHYHSSGHTAVPADWTLFLDFASRHFEATAN